MREARCWRANGSTRIVGVQWRQGRGRGRRAPGLPRPVEGLGVQDGGRAVEATTPAPLVVAAGAVAFIHLRGGCQAPLPPCFGPQAALKSSYRSDSLTRD